LADAFRIGGVKAHFCRRSMKAMISEFVTCCGKLPVKAHTERLAAGVLGSAPPKNGSLGRFHPPVRDQALPVGVEPSSARRFFFVTEPIFYNRFWF
jgi:hypothetical protein